MKNAYSLLAAALAGAGLLVACGGGSDATPASSSVSGVAMDGYLKDARAFLDKNGNGAYDSGEPSAMTTAGGKFKIDASADEVAKYPVVVEAIAGQTIDEDTGTAVKNGYKLSAPAGKAAVVSPLTTMVMAKMASGSSQSQAEAWALSQLGLSGDLYKDYVAGKDDAMHALAQNVVMVLEGAASSEDVVSGIAARADEIKTGKKSINIDFAAMAGSTPVDCSSNITALGTSAAAGKLLDLRFYIGNVKLVKADGSEVALSLGANDDWNATVGSDSVTLVDLEDKTGSCANGTERTNRVIRGTVPAGDYVGLKMDLGVPFAMNHTNQGADVSVTPAVINNAVHPGMAWSWAGGRKFTKIELTNAAWTAPAFYVHMGSTGCTGSSPSTGLVDSCSRPNRAGLAFSSFNPATQKVAVDVAALVAGNDVTVNGGGPGGCMGGATDPECGAVFTALGLDVVSGVAGSTAQTVFKAVAK